MNVRELKEILSKCPDDMEVIIPVINEDDANDIVAFRYVRTVGILSTPGEENAVCLNSSVNGVDISEQIKNRRSDVTCELLLR